jgi:hypothetical protein
MLISDKNKLAIEGAKDPIITSNVEATISRQVEEPTLTALWNITKHHQLLQGTSSNEVVHFI